MRRPSRHARLLALLAVTAAWAWLSLVTDEGLDPDGGASATSLLPPRRLLGTNLGLFDDPASVSLESDAPPPRLLSGGEFSQEASHGGDSKLCVAIVDDARLTTASVANADGSFRLSLPPPPPGLDGDRPAEFVVECTRTEEATGKATVVERHRGTAEGGGGAGAAGRDGGCDDPFSFKGGWYEKGTGTWTDACTGRRSRTTEAEQALLDPMSAEACPAVHRRGDVWVSIVGDSVTRQLLMQGLKTRGVEFGPQRERLWSVGRNSQKGRRSAAKRPDFILGKHSPRGLDGKVNVWFSYAFDYLDVNKTDGSMNFGLPPLTWGDFLDQRGEGQREDDPDYLPSRLPDLTILSPGYHSSGDAAKQYGDALDRVLARWRDDARSRTRGAERAPPTHLVLNAMPAPWMIPGKYEGDKAHRTLLEEYRKNLAIVEAGRKHDDVVAGVVDLFSSELPFNGVRGNTAHQDAVHLSEGPALMIMTDRFVDVICTPWAFGRGEQNITSA